MEVEGSVLWLQIARLRGTLAGNDEEARHNLEQWLYKKLIHPAAGRIADADVKRLLILPDGPLYYLPFAALPSPVAGQRYLVEQTPVHVAQSVTAYAEIRHRPRPAIQADAPILQWIGFGDPLHPVKVADADRDSPDPFAKALRSHEDRGIWDGTQELPFTGHEIREIKAQLVTQFPAEEIQAFVDKEATEDRARQIPPGTRIVHFATHGFAAPDQPADSFLVLSLFPEGETNTKHNGLLQAWEIIDHLELDADLVVLSACVTAFGPDRSGEGLLSLSRAFQIAGARSVLASLWAVNDASTAELMIRFYRHLLDEENPMTKDEALRAAQLEVIRDGEIEVVNAAGEKKMRDFSHPYHWAAFQLIGDWR